MELFRNLFPNKITPKLHILEHHCLDWIKTWGFGMAFHGEQGGELIHSSIAKLERRTAGMRKESKQLKSVMAAHRLQTSPGLQTLIPPTKRKKRETTPCTEKESN